MPSTASKPESTSPESSKVATRPRVRPVSPGGPRKTTSTRRQPQTSPLDRGNGKRGRREADRAVPAVGATLRRSFPRAPDDRNEPSDDVSTRGLRLILQRPARTRPGYAPPRPGARPRSARGSGPMPAPCRWDARRGSPRRRGGRRGPPPRATRSCPGPPRSGWRRRSPCPRRPALVERAGSWPSTGRQMEAEDRRPGGALHQLHGRAVARVHLQHHRDDRRAGRSRSRSGRGARTPA